MKLIIAVAVTLFILPALVAGTCSTTQDDDQFEVICNVTNSQEIATFFKNFDSSIEISKLTIEGTIETLDGQNVFGRNTIIHRLKIWTSSLAKMDTNILSANNRKKLWTLEVNLDSDEHKIESRLDHRDIFKLINLSNLKRAYVNVLPDASLEPGLCRTRELQLLVLSSAANIGAIHLEAFYECVQLQQVIVRNVPIDKVIHHQQTSSSSPNFPKQYIQFQNCSLHSSSFNITKPTIRNHEFNFKNNHIDDLRPLYGLVWNQRLLMNSFHLAGNPIDCSDEAHLAFILKAFYLQIEDFFDTKCSDGSGSLYRHFVNFDCTFSLHPSSGEFQKNIECVPENSTQPIGTFIEFLKKDTIIAVDSIYRLTLVAPIITTLEDNDIFRNVNITHFRYDVPLLTKFSVNIFGPNTKESLVTITKDPIANGTQMSAVDFFNVINELPSLRRAELVLRPNEIISAGMCKSQSLRDLEIQAESIEVIDMDVVSNCPGLKKISFAANVKQLRYDQYDPRQSSPIQWDFSKNQLTSDRFNLTATLPLVVGNYYDFWGNNIDNLKPLFGLFFKNVETGHCGMHIDMTGNPIDCRSQDHIDWMLEHLWAYLDCIHTFQCADGRYLDAFLRQKYNAPILIKKLELLAATPLSYESKFISVLGNLYTDYETYITDTFISDADANTAKLIADVTAKTIDNLLGYDWITLSQKVKSRSFTTLNTIGARLAKLINAKLSTLEYHEMSYSKYLVTWKEFKIKNHDQLVFVDSSGVELTFTVHDPSAQNEYILIKAAVLVTKNFAHQLSDIDVDNFNINTNLVQVVLETPSFALQFKDYDLQIVLPKDTDDFFPLPSKRSCLLRGVANYWQQDQCQLQEARSNLTICRCHSLFFEVGVFTVGTPNSSGSATQLQIFVAVFVIFNLIVTLIM